MATRLLAALSNFAERNFKRFFLVYLAAILFFAWRSEGWNQADEHARVLESAHEIVYGFGTLPWEFDQPTPMVSRWLGWVHAGPLFLAKQLNANGMTEAALLRMFSGLVNSTRMIAFFLVTGLIAVPVAWRGLLTVLFALAPFGPVLVVRTSQENWAMTALLWATFFVLRGFRNENTSTSSGVARRSMRDFLWGGLLLGLAASFRFQVGVCVGAIAVWMVFLRRPQAWFMLVLGIMVGLIPLALIDTWYNGGPFVPALNYLKYALGDEDGGKVWGTEPWHYYVVGFFTSFYPPWSLIIFPLMCVGMRSAPKPLGGFYVAMMVPFTIVHFILGHKELRYFHPIMPYFYLSAASGLAALPEGGWRAAITGTANILTKGQRFVRGTLRGFPIYIVVSMGLGIALASVPLHNAPRLYQEVNDMFEGGELPGHFTYVATSRSQFSQFYFKHPDHLPVKIDIDTFLKRLRDKEVAPGVYAIYRIDINEFAEVEEKCQPKFLSSPPWIRKLMRMAQSILRRKDVDAVVVCP